VDRGIDAKAIPQWLNLNTISLHPGEEGKMRVKLLVAIALMAGGASCASAQNATTTGHVLQVGVGDCLFDAGRNGDGQTKFLEALASAAISQGVNLLGKALTAAGAAKTWHVEGARNFQASTEKFSKCLQVVQGVFYKNTASVADIDGDFGQQKAKLIANGLFLAQKPDFFFEGAIVAPSDGSALSIRPVRSIFNTPIGKRALRKADRSVALFFAITAPAQKPSLDTAPAATIILGKQETGEVDDFVKSDAPASPYASSWFELAHDQAVKPLTITAMLSETQDEDKFLTFVGGLLSDDTVKSSLTKGLQVLVVPGEAAKADAADAAKAAATRTAQSLADEKFAIALSSLQSCEAADTSSAPTAMAALRDFLTADQDPSVKHRGTLTDAMITTIDPGQPAKVAQQCKAIYDQLVH